MHLYQGSTHQFIADATQARLANQLSDRFFEEFRYRPAPSGIASWRNSLLAMASVLIAYAGPADLRRVVGEWIEREYGLASPAALGD